jgi:DNA-binding response OmpR family regulator
MSGKTVAEMRKVHVAVISKDWQFRALVRAQLLEEGFEAIGLESVGDAIELLTWNRMRADIVLLDPDEQNLDQATISELRQLTGDAPIVAVLRRTVSEEDAVSVIQPARLLYRPFTVRRVVEVVKELAKPLQRGTLIGSPTPPPSRP